MDIQTACRVASTNNIGRPKCPRCGSIQLIAEQSAYNADGRIRHSWSCDDCGTAFVTAISAWSHQTFIDGPHERPRGAGAGPGANVPAA